jgi:hypothetical protein
MRSPRRPNLWAFLLASPACSRGFSVDQSAYRCRVIDQLKLKVSAEGLNTSVRARRSPYSNLPFIMFFHVESAAVAIGVISLLLSLDIFAVFGRLYTRKSLKQPLKADDWLVLSALVSQFWNVTTKALQ